MLIGIILSSPTCSLPPFFCCCFFPSGHIDLLGFCFLLPEWFSEAEEAVGGGGAGKADDEDLDLDDDFEDEW